MTTEPGGVRRDGGGGPDADVRSALDDLVNGVLHDLRGPLAIAGGYVGLLRDRGEAGGDDELLLMISAIERAHARMQALIDELLVDGEAVVRSQEGETEAGTDPGGHG